MTITQAEPVTHEQRLRLAAAVALDDEGPSLGLDDDILTAVGSVLVEEANAVSRGQTPRSGLLRLANAVAAQAVRSGYRPTPARP